MVGAGNGLFARRDIDEDEVICMYSGELKDVDKSNDSDYIVDSIDDLNTNKLHRLI